MRKAAKGVLTRVPLKESLNYDSLHHDSIWLALDYVVASDGDDKEIFKLIEPYLDKEIEGIREKEYDALGVVDDPRAREIVRRLTAEISTEVLESKSLTDLKKTWNSFNVNIFVRAAEEGTFTQQEPIRGLLAAIKNELANPQLNRTPETEQRLREMLGEIDNDVQWAEKPQSKELKSANGRSEPSKSESPSEIATPLPDNKNSSFLLKTVVGIVAAAIIIMAFLQFRRG